MAISSDFMLDCAEAILACFGEALTYRPKAGGTRSIYGVVDRTQIKGVPGIPSASSPRATIVVKNSSTGTYPGITSAEVDTGGDQIDYPLRIGDTAKTRRITKIISQNAGMMTLEVT